MQGFSVHRIEVALARALIEKHHYLHRFHPAWVSFGLLHEGVFDGVISFGKPAAR